MNEEILKRIDSLATKLGVTADHIWGVLVKQARVEFIEWMVWAGFWFVLATVAAWGFKYIWRHGGKDDPEIPVFLIALPGGISFLLALACVANTLTLIMNPEYWALKQITSMLGGK